MSSSFFKNTNENANMVLLSKFLFKCEILKISSQNCIMTKIPKKNFLPWHHRSPLCFCLIASVYLLSASSCSLFVPLSLLACCFVAIARISYPPHFAWLESYGQGWRLRLTTMTTTTKKKLRRCFPNWQASRSRLGTWLNVGTANLSLAKGWPKQKFHWIGDAVALQAEKVWKIESLGSR